MKNFRLCVWLLLFATVQLNAQVSIVSWGSSWKYLDNGIFPGTSWNSISFNDASWSSGNAELGYGDSDEATTVSYGPNSSSKYITTYFRKSFNVSNPQQFTQLTGELTRDDGAVIYLNGIEVFRSNMPGGAIGNQTLASSTVAWPNEDDTHTFSVSSGILVAGTNVIAVEIHQDDASSSDISFNFRSDASSAPLSVNVVRGPYLQAASTTSIVVRWRTDVPCDARVNFGFTPGNLTMSADSYTWTIEHEVYISGLSPAQLYYYNIGTIAGVLFSDPNMYFRTNPVVGTEQTVPVLGNR
jgi:hypothetical protein